MDKTLIKGGTIIDGSGKKAFVSDILIQGDRIIEIAFCIKPEKGTTVIDAKGLLVCPGFVDVHRHFDSALFRDSSFGELEVRQGITTAISGNCGLAPIPSRSKDWDSYLNYLRPITGPTPENTFKNLDYEGYYRLLKNKSSIINHGYLAAAGAICHDTLGWITEPVTEKAQAQLATMVNDAMENGAKGLSLGIMYQPECWMSIQNHVAMAKALRKHDGILTTHIRGEGSKLVSSIEEVIEIAKAAEVRLNISHFKATGIRNWNSNIHKAIDLIETARNSGMDVTVDFYPYDCGASTILSLLPPSASRSNLPYFGTQKGKEELSSLLNQDYPKWENMSKNIGWDRIIISSVSLPENGWVLGKSLKECADIKGYDDPAYLLGDLLASEGPGTGVIVQSMSADDIKTIASLDYSAIISDSLYADGSNPHPRLYGSFPKALKEFNYLSTEEIIKKMTALPAGRFGIKERGLLVPGNYADILVFDSIEFKDNATYTNPTKMATGLKYAFVNGCCTVENDRCASNEYYGIFV